MGESSDGLTRHKKRKFSPRKICSEEALLTQKIKFICIKKEGEGDLSKVSPFVINKAIVGQAGEPKNIKKLRDGTLLVECSDDAQANKLLKLKSFFDQVQVISEPHSTLNKSKGVIRSFELMETSSEAEILLGLKEDGYLVEEVKQIVSKSRGPTPTYILTFSTPTLPKTISAGYIHLEVKPYIPAPLRCFACMRFGHITGKCGRINLACRKCSQEGHKDEDCVNEAFCPNCPTNPNHSPLHPQCPSFLREKKIKEIQSTKKISINQARKEYELIESPKFSTSYAQKVSSTPSFISQNLQKDPVSTSLPNDSIWALPLPPRSTLERSAVPISGSVQSGTALTTTHVVAPPPASAGTESPQSQILRGSEPRGSAPSVPTGTKPKTPLNSSRSGGTKTVPSTVTPPTSTHSKSASASASKSKTEPMQVDRNRSRPSSASSDSSKTRR